MTMSTIEEAIEEIKNGKIVILVDDEDRENEGDLVVAAEYATPEVINFMATYGRGLICLAMTQDDADRIALQPIQPENNNVPQHTAFTIPIDARDGITTGISAYDRSSTVQLAISEDSRPDDFVRPGHVFPLIARKGGVLVRAGHTEGSVDLARLAGLKSASVICEIMKDDGDMARLEDLQKFANTHGIKIATIADLIGYRLSKESFVRKAATANIPTDYGTFKTIVYESEIDSQHHVAFVKGNIDTSKEVLVRVHSDCLISDVFGAKNSDSRSKLIQSMKMIEENGCGVILYIRSEGNGRSLINKINEYKRSGKITDPMDLCDGSEYRRELRNYGIGAQILRDLGVRKLRLLTNNPTKVKGLEGFGLQIVERRSIPVDNSGDDKPVNNLKDKDDILFSVIDQKGV